VIPLIPGITSLEAAMMGRLNSDQGSLFYAFRLDDRVRSPCAWNYDAGDRVRPA
jgi:hypothetical protein